LLLVCLAASARAQAIDDEFYIVQKGDTCVSVSAKVWPGDPEKVNTLHALNPEVGKQPEPHKLRPGMRLRIRADNPDARVTFIRPKVNAKRRGKPDWNPAQQGQGLYRLDSVNTLDGAAAAVRFRDQSELSLDANALIVIYGINKGAALKLRTPKSGSVELVHGDMRLRLKELRGEGPKVTTPAASIAVMPGSKEMAVGVDDKKMSRISVIDGEAEIEGKGKARKEKLRVAKGYGTRIEPGKPPEPPEPLPPAPPWTTPGARDVWISLDDQGADLGFGWTAVASAVRYRAQLARDPAMNDTLINAVRVGAVNLEVKQPSIPVGRYHARVSGYTQTGLVGMPSVIRVIDVVRVSPGPTARPLKAGVVTGVGELALAVGDTPDLEITLDGARVPSTSLVVRGVGAHQVKIGPKGDAGRTAALEVEIVAPRAQIELTPAGDALEARVRLLDPKGAAIRLAQAPELVLTGKEGTKVAALTRSADGSEYTTRVEPATTADARRAVVTAQWNQLEIGTQENVKILPRKPRPVIAVQPVALVSPVGQVGAKLDYAAVPNAWMPPGLVFAVRVQPKLSETVMGERGTQVAISTEVPLARRFVFYGTLAGRDIGQLPVTLGLRAQVAHGQRFGLGAAADMTMSSLDGGPALHARGSLLATLVFGRLGLQLSGGVIGGSEARGGRVGGQGNGTLAFYLTSRFLVALGAEHLRGDGFAASGAAASLRFRVSPFELQLGARKGFGDDGEAGWSKLAGVVFVEYRAGARW